MAEESESHHCGGFSLSRQALERSSFYFRVILKINNLYFTNQDSSMSTAKKETRRPQNCFQLHSLRMNIYSSRELALGLASLRCSLSQLPHKSIVRSVAMATEGSSRQKKLTVTHTAPAGSVG